MRDDLTERGPDGLWTPWALACQALIDHGCDCDDPDYGTCLACKCEVALHAERTRAEGAELDLARLRCRCETVLRRERTRAELAEAEAARLSVALEDRTEQLGTAKRDLARLGGPDPDAGLWDTLARLAGVEGYTCRTCSGTGCTDPETGEECGACRETGTVLPDVHRAVVVGLLRRRVLKQLREDQAKLNAMWPPSHDPEVQR